ncbi:hypothetical protein [Actinoplanes sp. NPDC049118]|uniref:hypothetical protein n=1 Tax=Actinoplanes sp. NPDC049118 TaxID=3155769 RepID=UPI0033D02865
MSRSRLAAATLSGLLALAGCGYGGEQPVAGPKMRSKSQANADVARYAEQTVTILRATTTGMVVTESACAEGLYSVQAVYRLPMGLTRHPRARAVLRNTWQANKMPITLDTTVDGYRGAISTVTPDGYTIDVVTITSKPKALSLQVRSPCLWAP